MSERVYGGMRVVYLIEQGKDEVLSLMISTHFHAFFHQLIIASPPFDFAQGSASPHQHHPPIL